MGGSLTYEEIKDILDKYPLINKITNFVETGTYKADTSMMAAEYFRNVYTIEIMETLYNQSKKRAETSGVENINFYLGDSLKNLPEILTNMEPKSAFFFIDAHQSGSDTGNNNKQLVPLYEELDIILSHDLSCAVLIFDDVRFWSGKNKEAWDWAHISEQKIIEKIEEQNYNIIDSYIKNDRFFVIIS